MRIAFLSLGHADFHADTPYVAPLGGSESAACHLAATLAFPPLGHEVAFFSRCSSPGTHRGVRTFHWDGANPAPLRAFKPDVAIILRLAGHAARLRSILPAAKLLLWIHDDARQASVQALRDPAEVAALSGIAAVSHWQREEFLSAFSLPPALIRVQRNPLPPPFLSLFPSAESILAAKAHPPLLAYTSTPFRGLAILLELFPRIRVRCPDVRLQVFSSMKVYQIPAAQDAASFGELYARCRGTEGVDYLGSLPQPALAQALRRVSLLAYPNNFPETCCLSALEAMTAGCHVISSDLAALPETTSGHATLIPLGPGYKDRFVDSVVQTLTHPPEESLLRQQMDFVKKIHAPATVARSWQDWLNQLTSA